MGLLYPSNIIAFFILSWHKEKGKKEGGENGGLFSFSYYVPFLGNEKEKGKKGGGTASKHHLTIPFPWEGGEKRKKGGEEAHPGFFPYSKLEKGRENGDFPFYLRFEFRRGGGGKKGERGANDLLP